jgi:hypothetical protein
VLLVRLLQLLVLTVLARKLLLLGRKPLPLRLRLAPLCVLLWCAPLLRWWPWHGLLLLLLWWRPRDSLLLLLMLLLLLCRWPRHWLLLLLWLLPCCLLLRRPR